jgi:hypothetical protein
VEAVGDALSWTGEDVEADGNSICAYNFLTRIFLSARGIRK